MRTFALLIATGLLLSGCQSVVKQVADHRESYKQDFLTDPRSPLQQDDFQYLDFYPPAKNAVVKATFRLTPKEEPFELPTYSGITRTYRKWGVATFTWNDVPCTLAVYENMTFRANPVYSDYLFLPFKDESSGVETYGGGRYLNMSKKDTEDGRITIDFNKCYNPWCAFSDGFNCPIPPVENHLTVAIEAGERMYKGEVKRKVQ